MVDSLLGKLLFWLSLPMLFLCSNMVQAERIRDLTSIEGMRENTLIGYGLVVGLDGTGD